jgi:transposase-like protein
MRRRHAPEFKAQVIEACLQPGVSVAAVALANGLNANYLRRWVKEHREQMAGSGVATSVVASDRSPAMLIPVEVEPAVATDGDEIRLDIRRGGLAVQIAWPVGQSAVLGTLLRELLR